MLNFIKSTPKKHALACFSETNRLLRVALISDGHQHFSGPVTVEIPTGSDVRDVVNRARAAERAVAWCTAHGDPVTYVASPWRVGSNVTHQYHGWQTLTPREQDSFVSSLAYPGAPTSPAEVNDILEARCTRYMSDLPLRLTLGDLIDATVLGLFCLGRFDKFGIGTNENYRPRSY